MFYCLISVQIRNLVEGKSYKFRLRCCFSSKEEKGPSSSMSLRDDAVDAEQLHWSAFGPPSDDFKVSARRLLSDGCCYHFAMPSSWTQA
jgi:hypothetical protein